MSGRRARQERKRLGEESAGAPRSAPAVRRSRRRKAGAAAFAVLAAGTLLLAGYLLKPAILGRETPSADAGVIDIAADMAGFDRSVIRVKVGEPVTVRLTSLDNRFHTDGGGRHQLAVDELGVDIVAPALGSASQTFTPSEPGTYVFYCDICCGGRANPAMSGKLLVVEA